LKGRVSICLIRPFVFVTGNEVATLLRICPLPARFSIVSALGK